MKNAFQMITELADTLDQQRKVEAPILVRGSRAYLRKWFKPQKRGGPLRIKGHELVVLPAAKKTQLDQVELLA